MIVYCFMKQNISEEHEGPHPVDTTATEGQVDTEAIITDHEVT
jgi:hypothetical protein